jgi:hypothetical protein
MVADELDYVVGVDTHRDEHTLALVETASGAVLAQRTVASNGRGYAGHRDGADGEEAGAACKARDRRPVAGIFGGRDRLRVRTEWLR